MFHVKHEVWPSVASSLGLHMTHAEFALLDGYLGFLSQRGLPMGIVAAGDADRLVERHVGDALRGTLALDALLADRGGGASEGLVVDLGSGGGLPGIPLAIVRPRVRFMLTEVRRNRAAFLAEVVRALGLPNVEVHAGKAERLEPNADVALARAFASPEEMWRVANRVLSPGGSLLYWAGERFSLADDVPEGATGAVFPAPTLAPSGPLVIMARQ
jgi:16S rRNA (guanine527-N7)-methyltransferase